ncbi:MAG: hypothetical protein OQK75_04335 [Gammaproteobacteria bacterium]|nr:hypothetical protein [Gammaproteobacteria bacterium]MCW8986879.1 hypothetical protein [Gammaproteobacteria bacterium]MCW9031302.1 hypothetical protein [Gammaproteobacteria bacterium]
MTNMNYSINLNKQTIYCKFEGKIEPEALVKFISEIRSNPEFHNGLNTIADFQEANISEDYMEINMLADYIINNATNRGDFKLAVICGPETINSVTLYKILTSDKHVKACLNEQEALDWVAKR